MLGIVDTFGEDLPPTCQSTCQEAWAIFDPFLAKYGSDYQICERTTRVLRLGLTFFGDTALPVLPSVLGQMAQSFESTGHSSYLWISGKVIGRFGNEESPQLRASFQEVYERSSHKVLELLQTKAPAQIPDGTLFLLACEMRY